MKTKPVRGFVCHWLLPSVLVLSSAAPQLSFCQPSHPVIAAIRPDGTNVLVIASVPAGFQRITLEGRARFGSGTWAPVAVVQAGGAGGSVTFRLPCSKQAELLRLRADAQQALPASFYGGTNSFLGPPTNSIASPAGPGLDGVAGPGAGSIDGSSRPVVESDIWKLDGDRLFFFNQYRGLQIIDIRNPDVATVRGTLALPASGEQMYLANSNHVVLLARNGCVFGTDESQIILVAISNNLPQAVTNLVLGGWIQESRMVGTALYVASQTYRQMSGSTNGTWEWGTLISSFDLANPELPVSRGTLWYSGYGNVVAATDTYLFVVTQDPNNWWQSIVRIIDITAADGTMAPYASITTAGQVPDKFKLNYSAGIFTSISEDWRSNNRTALLTRLETFHLPDPRSAGPGSITKLGQLELGNGQRLHATRFDGNLVYVVTFFQIDPLWVVDLSDPARPHIAGSLEVPGWSTYIQPLGARLVTVGVQSNRVAVSLFDVHDPSHPKALSQLLLGQNYSWSEANNDEKAFTVLPELGLILVPYSGDTTNGWTSRVQLIDLNTTNLVARGMIEHQFAPRRATFSHNRVLSLSEWELLSVDATDRDHPILRGDTGLAWSVDRLFLHGNYLLELTESTGWWGYQARPTVRVATSGQPDQVLGELALDSLPIVGAALKDNRLYVAQSQAYYYPIPLDGGPGGSGSNATNFFLTVIDVSHLPNLSILGQTAASADVAGLAGNWKPVWPKPDVLVWAGGGLNFWWFGYGEPAGPAGGLVSSGPIPWPFWRFGGGELLAFDVSNPAAPKFDSEVNLSTNGWWSFSPPFSSGTLVYLSHSASEFLPPFGDWPGNWMQRSYLDVIDYANPLSPTVRPPANIPGTLQGLSNAGELLYTVGVHYTTNTYDWSEWLDASAYDGVVAHLVDSLPLPNAWPHPVLVDGTNVYIGRPGYNNNGTITDGHQLETWTLLASGKFSTLGRVGLSNPASSLLGLGSLLAVQETDNAIDLFDDSAPAALKLIGNGRPPGCLWFDLSHADGAVDRGLWIPLGVYGVGQVFSH